MAVADRGPIGFSCAASGVEVIAPMTADEACARVRAEVEQALGTALVAGEAGRAGGIAVSLTFGTVIAKADVIDSRSGTARALPTLYQSTFDRSLDVRVVDTLARAVGTALTR